ncbi:Uncharacterized protein TCM_017473 [Theobroma cacao]|uniref:Uncharacterized protein n=1 Tax=Theobroma cacao TaxID=3641 RepID=A0A061EDI7_THECC|nr:Uncharacterized protein TCM_017473 [Theobroma cacao]
MPQYLASTPQQDKVVNVKARGQQEGMKSKLKERRGREMEGRKCHIQKCRLRLMAVCLCLAVPSLDLWCSQYLTDRRPFVIFLPRQDKMS